MHIFLLDLVSWIIFGGEHKLWSFSLCNFLHSSGISSLSVPNIPLCSTLHTQPTRHLRLPQCCWYKSQVFWDRKSSARFTLKNRGSTLLRKSCKISAIRQGVTPRYNFFLLLPTWYTNYIKLIYCNLCKRTRNLCIKLVIIKKLYYDARPIKYQSRCPGTVVCIQTFALWSLEEKRLSTGR